MEKDAFTRLITSQLDIDYKIKQFKKKAKEVSIHPYTLSLLYHEEIDNRFDDDLDRVIDENWDELKMVDKEMMAELEESGLLGDSCEEGD